jgi:hypothetical protein
MQTHIHGFLNIFTAGVAAHALQLSEDQVRKIIEDETASNFVFDDKGIHWKSLRASATNTMRARKVLVTSFGSCSFEEPCNDLRAMGLIP